MTSKHIRLLGGTLKIKTEDALRGVEKDGRFPLWKIGKWYLIWWRGI
jgi:hypothetical protein